VDWPNPNLDVPYSEAWVAVDENSCTIVSVPMVEDRNYIVQFLNGWGGTLANINERVFPQRPCGDFAICLQGATMPADSQRIDLLGGHSRVPALRAGAEGEARHAGMQGSRRLRSQRLGAPRRGPHPQRALRPAVFAAAYRKIATAAGWPNDVWNMDT